MDNITVKSCRYDVVYGSQGFQSYGYMGGCAFANGTVQEALQEPSASRFLCNGQRAYECTHNFAGIGQCTRDDGNMSDDYEYYEGFDIVDTVCCALQHRTSC